VAAGVTLVFVLAFSEFTVSALMGGGTFAVVSVYIFQAMTTLLDWGLGAALAALLLLSSAAIVTAFNSITRKLMPWTQPKK
jgi:putative spermidine/putrescine transport system permease protein